MSNQYASGCKGVAFAVDTAVRFRFLLSQMQTSAQARQSIAEQQKLAAEKNALIETVKRLNRELARLEHFKKNLLQQLQDEEQVGACL